MIHLSFSQQRRGAVLLLSLLLMSTITAGTIAVAVLLIRTYRQTVSLDHFISASLGADTGIERSLAVIKAGRKKNTLEETLAELNQTEKTLANSGAKYRVNALPLASAIPTSLANGQGYSFDILKNGITPPSQYLWVTSVCNSPCSTPGVIEVAWIMNTSSGRSFAGRQYITAGVSQQIDLNVLYSDSNNIPNSADLTSTVSYRVQIQATKNSISNIVTQPRGALDGLFVPTAQGTIQLKATGSLQSTQALKTANVLWQLPSSGIFNFVLFTEGSIIPPS